MLFLCFSSLFKIIDWLLKASDLVLASQSDIDKCGEQAAHDLQQEHGDFVSATHESGLQLIDTAQILRERCALPTEVGGTVHRTTPTLGKRVDERLRGDGRANESTPNVDGVLSRR